MVAQEAAAHGDAFGGDRFLKNGVIHGVGGKNCQIRCRGVVILGIQTMGVLKVGILHPQHPGFVVHLARKLFDASAAIQSQRRRRIIAGGEHQAVQQLLKRQNFPFLKIHGRAFNAHGFFGDLHLIQHIAPFTDQQRRHDFGSAGDEAFLIRIFAVQRPAADGVRYNGALGRYGVHRARNKQHGGQQCSRRGTEDFFHSITRV